MYIIQGKIGGKRNRLRNRHFFKDSDLKNTLFIYSHQSAHLWHNIGIVLLFYRKSISVILGTVKNFADGRFPKKGAAVLL